MTKEQILKALDEQQRIQMVNPPSSEAWIKASDEIDRLANLLTGGKSKAAWGRS